MDKLTAIRELLEYCQEEVSGETRVVDTVYHGESAFQSDKFKQLIANALNEMDARVYAIDWGDAPEWAEYFAVDDMGLGMWFECEPSLFADKEWIPIKGRRDVAFRAYTKVDEWKKSLLQRP